MSSVLDTHAVVWYLEGSNELSPIARTAIDDAVRTGRQVYVSAISLIEMVYLAERNRIPSAALPRLRSALAGANASLIVAPVDAVIAEVLESIPRDLLPDMPDRIIAATALRLDLPLVTRDRRMHRAGIKAIW